MQHFFTIIAICGSLTIATSTPNEASLLTPPPPAVGQSVGQWIDQIFDDPDDPSTTFANESAATAKRGILISDGTRTVSWTNDTEKASYNITVDFSNTCSGLNYTTDIGVYTFTNGTTTNETRLIDMIKDLWSLQRVHHRNPNNAANHTATIAQLALDEANQALRSGLICGQNQTTGPITELVVTPQRDELRHLLPNRWSYWTAIFLAAGIGALSGAGIAALSDLIFKGDVHAENVVQTATIVATATIIGGILSRMHEIGRLDRAENMANRVQRVNARAGEAVVQNVAMSWGRRQIQRIIRREVEEAMSDVMSGANAASIPNPASIPDPGTPLDPGTPFDPNSPIDSAAVTPQRGVTTPGSRTSGSHGACLQEGEARAAAVALGDMSSREFELRTEAEISRLLAERGEGDCNV